MGLKGRNLCLNYAYRPHEILGETRQFSVGFYFGRLEKEEVLSPEEEKGRAGVFKPENKKAIGTMKEANRLLYGGKVSR